MAKNLLIVESPAKSKTIGKYLGKDFVIKASMGHIVDLPVKEFGIDIENDFDPKYVTMKGKTKIITELKKHAKKCENIYLAPDPDREGEAIAWHIQEILSKVNKKAKIHRVLFNEITKTAVVSAIENPLELDYNKVQAQQARRILDRIVGYKISPFLWKAMYRGLSAGRVQSVALRIICEREAERDAFNKVEYWTIDANVEKDNKETFSVKLAKVDGKDPVISNAEEATKIVEESKNAEWKIESVKFKKKKRNPHAPFITSTIQQAAAQALHFSASKTMSVAQQLYEGLDIGEESVGLITYMRTDSTRIADEAKKAANDYISKTYGKEYLSPNKGEFKKNKKAQDAHEAIRPSQITSDFSPKFLKDYLSADQFKLYDLIWKRFLSSQMAPAEFDSTTIDIPVKNYLYRANGSILRFDGFMSLYKEVNEDKKDTDTDTLLPEIKEGESLTPLEFDDVQHFTQPPPRYSEASLVKELEKQGIGRPSTYAQIIDTLKRRKYVEVETRRFFPTYLGIVITKLLVQAFPDVFNVKFTANMEDHLDKVESGEDNWIKILSQFYAPLEKDLIKANDNAKDIKKSMEEVTDEPCSVCEKPMVIKWGRNGRFMACSDYPKCRNTKPLETDEEEDDLGIKCKRCGKDMKVKRWKKSRFLGCSDYPTCHSTMPFPIGMDCPEEGCNGYIAERYSQKGKVFYSCSEYPDCKFANWNKPVNKVCVCGAKFMVERTSKTKGEYLKCLTCKHEIILETEEVDEKE